MRVGFAMLVLMSGFASASLATNARAKDGPPCWAPTTTVPACIVYNAYVVRSVRASVPAQAPFGYGRADCSFHVTARGAVTRLACSGSSDAHAIFLRNAISRLRLMPPPRPWALHDQSAHFR